MAKEKIILKYLRFTEAGTPELVTWLKTPDGVKRCEIAAYYPTFDELISMKADKHRELFLPNR
jgi:hypothetical protein